MTNGIYETLITESLAVKLRQLDDRQFYIHQTHVDHADAVRVLSMHLQEVIARAFQNIKANKDVLLERQIEISNRLIAYLHDEINHYDFEDDLLDAKGGILKAVFSKIDADYADLNLRLQAITPASGLTQSELFTGGNMGLSLDGELKKEIRSANRVDLLVSFIKWKAIVLLRDALKEFTDQGGQLRVITTTYMGATDAKAIQELSTLSNTQIRVSYNTSNERLHAKAYLFYRDTGFHTGYIGSSNFSRSALTDGLEWNVKITTKEIPHVIDKFRKTFETYWQNPEFELYNDSKHFVELSTALNRNKLGKTDRDVLTYFDVKPYHYQREVLEKLQVEREVHGVFRNLVIAATGTGKTMISAFDFKNRLKKKPESRLLFIAHRIEILRQARHTFRNVLLEGHNFGELLGDGYEPAENKHIFATIQTLANRIKDDRFPADYYDYVILDEVHHAAADSYQQVIRFLNPDILLGLTATPERADGKSILGDFNQRVAAEIRLPDALNNKLLSPFQYFVVSDSVDLEAVKWGRGKYDVDELTKLYTGSDLRVRDIIRNLDRYCKDIHEVLALGFCVSKEHANFMARKFELAGLRAAVLTSDNAQDRTTLLSRFRKRDFNYLFVVDMFNEGVDIPEIDTVLFLRPTESLTIFLQQLGRGLRLHESKDVLTVLDFVGNAHPDYDFESKFRALIGKTNNTVLKEIENDFNHLPLGCSIVLEKKAKEVILNNIRRATSFGKRDLVRRLQNYINQTSSPLSLSNFLRINNIPYQRLYLRGTWSALCADAGLLNDFDRSNEKHYMVMLRKKWAATNSLSYFKFILSLAENGFKIEEQIISELDKLHLTMLHYDFWQEASPSRSLQESIETIGRNKHYLAEIVEYLRLRISLIDFEESVCTSLGYQQPLQLHGRYTRDQILAAFQLSTLDKKNPNREGSAENKLLNTELLFVNLQKSESDFSPTTMYEDYAISETLFHWQSQNRIADNSPRGRSYITHAKFQKKILLFVRESKHDMYGNTVGYVFVGPAHFVDYEGSKPMSITWNLEKPIPEYLWTASAKMAVG